MDGDYNDCFDFALEEVKDIAEYFHIPERMCENMERYDGYVFGGMEIYCPCY